MNKFEIHWKKSAVKSLSTLPKDIIKRVIADVDSLANNPFPANSKKLLAIDNCYRIRISDYRVVYKVLNNILVIEIIKVAHRKDVYK